MNQPTDLWKIVNEQAQTYGNVNTAEIDWGQDCESDTID